MLLLSGVTHAVEPEEAWVSSWGARMVVPTPVWQDEVDSWDPTAFSGQFNQLTSSTIVFVNVSHSELAIFNGIFIDSSLDLSLRLYMGDKK